MNHETIIDLEVESGLEPVLDVYPNATVKMSRAQYSTFQLKRMVEETGQILLDPEFQRNQVWTKKQKQELVESILMGIPLPVIYFFEDKYGKKQMVDGRQRVSAIVDFMNDRFELDQLTMLPKFNGKKFSELEPIHQNRFEEFQISAYIIEPPTPEQIKYDIFDRVNRGGTKLNNQEMRNALYFGKSTQLLKTLSESQAFQEATGASVDPKRMKDRYAILRMLGFYLLRTQQLPTEYKSNIDEFLVVVMNVLNKKDDEEIEHLSSTFIRAMQSIYKMLGEDAFRFSDKHINKRPINMALFESIGYLFMIKTLEGCKTPETLKAELEALKSEFDTNDYMKYAVDSSKNVDLRLSRIEQFAQELSC